MNIEMVRILIFPAKVDPSYDKNYDPRIYGSIFSALDEILVNKVPDGYTILYRDDIFANLQPEIFGEGLINLFKRNLPETEIEIEIYYFYMGKYFFDKCGKVVLQLDDYLSDCEDEWIDYLSSESVLYLMNHYDEDTETFNVGDTFSQDRLHQSPFEEERDEDLEDEYEDSDIDITEFLGCDTRKMKKKSYGRSKVLQESKNAKKNIKRHGILISSNKSARKRDEKILRSVLKDFIPGKSRWIKDFRKIVLDRWMHTYVISKKFAKRLAKDHKSHSKKRKGNNLTENALDFTKRMFQTYDPFYDPKR